MSKKLHMVTVKVELGSESLCQETRTDAFLKGLSVSRRGDLYELGMGPGLRVTLPREVMVEAVSDLLSMLEPEEQREILASVERGLR